MREFCPNCGSTMHVSTEAFKLNGNAIEGIAHLSCPSCGEITFTPEQSDELFKLRREQRKKEGTAA